MMKTKYLAVVSALLLAGCVYSETPYGRYAAIDLPLWHRLTEEQAATLKQYHQWSRTGRIEQDDDAKRTSAGRSGHHRSGRTGAGTSKAAPSKGSSSAGAMSKRDRARAADVRRRRQGREGRSSH
ncbi:MAG: hypothetical protein ACFNLH_09390 [Corynebacterium matruchotii]